MDLSIRGLFLLWTVVGFVSLAATQCTNENSKGNGLEVVAQFKNVFRNVCYEFSETTMSWSGAQAACVQRGGELLTLIDCPVKEFLRNFTKKRNYGRLTWWVGEGVPGKFLGTTLLPDSTSGANDSTQSDSFPFLCTYMRLDPFELVTTTNCKDRRGYLCTLDLIFSTEIQNNSSSSIRDKRDLIATLAAIATVLPEATSIADVLKWAFTTLTQMEQTSGQPTDADMIIFINNLMVGVNSLTVPMVQASNQTAVQVLNCTSAIHLLYITKCPPESQAQQEKMFQSLFQIYAAISLLLAQATGQPMVIKHSTGYIYQSTHSPAELADIVLGSLQEGVLMKLPPISALAPTLAKYSTISTQMATYSVNPVSVDDNITGMLCSLNLSSNDQDIRLTNLSQSISIYLPRANASDVSNVTLALQERSSVISSFNISDTNQTVVFSLETNSNLSFLFLLAPGSPPNETYHVHSTTHNYSSGMEGRFRWFVTPEMLQQTSGIWYISFSLYNSTWRPDVSLEITIFNTKCMYWDAVSTSWRIDGCRVGPETRPNRTHCLCNHLTLFGSSFFVMPNFVDVSLTAQYFATVSQNYVVVVLLSCFFALYLMTAFWAFYADRRAKTRRRMTLLEDTHPCAQYNYMLSVQTGSRKAAGTSANVTVKLIGLETESETHRLSDPLKPLFERGADDVFLLATPFPLGDLRSVRLQHDNTGEHPSWYVNKVVIQDLQTHQVWHFLCSSWLSSEKGEGMIKKAFNAAQKNEIDSFRNIFQTRTSSGFRDQHIWVSVVDPPARSPFTRLQRVSCCMSLLLCTMAINIAFWNMAPDENSPVIFSIGSFKLTWQQIMVGVESALLMFPINILIITIFRSIKPRLLEPEDNDYPMNLKPMAVTMTTILRETEDLLSVLSRSKKNQLSPLDEGLESGSDISPALDRVHDLILLMQGESEGDPHWIYCSRYLQSCLSHLCMYLERLDEKAFPEPCDHQQTLGKANLLFSKAQMVLTSHISFCPAPVIPKKSGSNFWLPWWFAFIGWFLLLSISAISTYFTLLYGFQYGKEKSIQWVISLGLSLFQSIFILQPLKVIGLAIFFALLLKPVAVEENEEIEMLLKKQRERSRQYSGRDIY